jgi:hypothetical protein
MSCLNYCWVDKEKGEFKHSCMHLQMVIINRCFNI